MCFDIWLVRGYQSSFSFSELPLESFYSTGIRCGELDDLKVYDLEADQGVLTIRLGKRGEDRVVPIGERVLSLVTND